MKITLLLSLAAAATTICPTFTANAFTLEMMGGRRGKGNLKRSLDPSAVGDKGVVKSGGVASL
jgi:hypothetical protein